MENTFNLQNIVRTNIWNLKPYTSARDEYTGTATTYLDANENAFGSPLPTAYNRYPDPYCTDLKQKLSTIKGVPPQHIFVGNGSDEAIDILYRMVCEPAKDNVIICMPTYGMYSVSAAINNVAVIDIPLINNFELDVEAIINAINTHTKIIWICSPNNPTGNSMSKAAIEILLKNFKGLIVIDEAYINYSQQQSCISYLTQYPNVVVLQTMSKAWGLAGLRVGMAYAATPIIALMNSIKPPYNVNQASQLLTLEALHNVSKVNSMITQIVTLRTNLTNALMALPFVQTVYASDANFVLVKIEDNHNATTIYNYLCNQGIVVRNRATAHNINNCLRITVGTLAENELLLTTLTHYKNN